MRTHDMAGAGTRLLVAVSGGPDSTGLLGALARLRRPLGIEVVAGHVNHRLRAGDADADEACAAAAASTVGVPFVRAELPAGLGRGGNLEQRARRLRYETLHALAAAHGCARIATGHTRDDQAETVLLRVLRGTSPGGLAAIEPHRADGVVRPLIDCARADVLRFVEATGLAYRIDASNADARFRRNRVRRDVLPVLAALNPEIVAALARLADLARAERRVIAAWAAARAGEVAEGHRLFLSRWRAIPEELRGHVLREWLVGQGVPSATLDAELVDGVRRFADGAKPSGGIRLPGGRRLSRRYQELVLGGDGAGELFAARTLAPGRQVRLAGGWRIAASVATSLGDGAERPGSLWRALCDADGVDGPFTIRPAVRGERVRPLGSRGTRKLSDIFTDRKIPAAMRWTYPVVEHRGEVVWVPGVVRCERLRVAKSSRSVLWLQAEREAERGA